MDKQLRKNLENFLITKTEDLSNLDAEQINQLVFDSASWMYDQLKDKLCECGGNCSCKEKSE